jgi:thiol-disulfide isomerase/thioredoxin
MSRLLTALTALVIGFGVAYAAAEPAVGSVAPEFGGTKFFNNPQGSNVSLSSLKGKVVLVDFWATWCGPCVASIPHLIELHEKYHRQGLVIIGHTDASSQGLEAFIKEKKIPYIISVGPNIGDAYGVSGIPHVFVIDPEGKVAWHGHPASMPESAVTEPLKRARVSATPTPSFEQAASVEKVAKIEAAIVQSGKVGTGVKLLEKMATDKDAATASSAQATLQKISDWKVKVNADIEKLKTTGDVYSAAELAAAVAASYAGHDEAKEFTASATALKKDPAYAAGKEYQKLDAIPSEARKDPRFAKMVEGFLKKYESGYYADQAKALLK